MSKARKVRQEPGAIIHDHFDGSANCRECGGECTLSGGNLIATELARWICERAAFAGWSGLPISEAWTLERAGIDPKHFLARAKETNQRS